MATKLEGDAAIAELATKQHGLITREQALKAGISSSGIDRRLANGSWESVYERVYRLRGTPRSEWQKVLAACLHGGPEAFASHRTAAWLWKLDGFLDAPPRKVEISVPHDRRPKLKGVEVYRRRDDKLEHTLKEGIPTTLLARTICDLAALLKEDALEIALDSAGRGKPEFLEDLAELLGKTKGRGRKGNGVLGALVLERRGDNATGSSNETEVLRAVRKAKLPRPSIQYPVFEKDDHPFMHLDFAWPAQKVALLPDGVGVHMTKRQFEKDAVQRAKLTAMGWRWVNVTKSLISEGTWLKAIATLLRSSK
jgi:hypothetical protein